MYQLYVRNRKTPKTMIKIIFLFGSRKSKTHSNDETGIRPATNAAQFRFLENCPPTLPKSTLTLTSHLRQNFGLGEG